VEHVLFSVHQGQTGRVRLSLVLSDWGVSSSTKLKMLALFPIMGHWRKFSINLYFHEHTFLASRELESSELSSHLNPFQAQPLIIRAGCLLVRKPYLKK
jgi:hypothetical protein